MIKTKTFQFLVSNAAGNALDQDSDLAFRSNQNSKHPVKDEKAIDKKVNAWIEKENAEVISLNVTSYAVDRHNNGRHDTIVLVYTILYRETKQEG